MDNLVIFSSPAMCVVIALTAVLHIAAAFIPLIVGKGESFERIPSYGRVLVWVAAALNALLHILLIGYAFLKSAEPEEMLLVIMISASVAMASLGISGKKTK